MKIEEEYFALHYRTGFKFKNHMLMVEIDEKGDDDRDPDYEKRRQRKLEKLSLHFIRISMIMKNLVE